MNTEITSRIMSLKHAEPLARDFMARGVVTVFQESNVDKAVKAMDDHNIGSVVVVDSIGPCGIFTERDLLSKVLARGKEPALTVISEVTSPRFPSLDSTATLDEAAKAMIVKKSRLMVFEGDELVGIVTPTDIIKVLKGAERDFSILRVISTRLVTVQPETPTDVAVRLMDERKVGSVIVTEDTTWSGIFTERDLVKRVLVKKKRLDAPMREVGSFPLLTAEPGIFGREAAGMMAVHGIKRLPLCVDGEGVGIVTARDLVEAFVNAGRSKAVA